MNIGDKVLIKRGGGRGLTWKILKIEGDRAQVDLVRGSLLGPQWEDLTSLEPDYGTGCRCDWLGQGTPEHTPSALCVSLRPDGPRAVRHEKDVIDKGEITCPACLDGSCFTQGLPDPNIAGPCQLKVSILCEPSAGRQRMDPMDMAQAETSFRRYVMCCQACYDAQADEYIRVTHGRA